MEAAPYYAPTYFAPSYFNGTSGTTPLSVSPYNAPTYFAPSYFSGSVTPVNPGMMPYNAPAYFAPAYFYGPSSTATLGSDQTNSVVTTDPVDLDEMSYSALMALVNGTGGFEAVILGSTIRRGCAGADTYPLAVLTPRGWEESDDFDPTSIVRRTTFSITVVVKSEEDLPVFDPLERLSTAIKKVVDGSDLNGTCLPKLTRIYSGHFLESSRYPEHSIELKGEFSRIINP